jgi:hypothetical protein
MLGSFWSCEVNGQLSTQPSNSSSQDLLMAASEVKFIEMQFSPANRVAGMDAIA